MQLGNSLAIGTLFLALSTTPAYSQLPPGSITYNGIDRVMLISIDGMHAVDFANCSKGIPTVNGGLPYCPNLAALATTGITYPLVSTSRPSDSFPGSAALATGGSPKSTGFYYDVSYDRALSPPTVTTPYGIVGGANLCPGTVGAQVGFDEEIDVDYTQFNGGGGIQPLFLPRDPKNGCAPVYPHNYLRVNTMFEVVRATGGYTAWSDKHIAYDFYNGPSGTGVNDFYSPEINSIPVPLPSVPGCSPLPDPGAATSSNAWTDSFQNIQCYDGYKVQIVLNWINGLWHDGSYATRVPTLFGMNFQVVSVGQKLVEKGVTGGYLDAVGTPSPSLLSEIEFADKSIGQMVAALQKNGIFNSTLIIITAKHGQSPIDPARVLRIPHDDSTKQPPSAVLGSLVAQALEDDVSLLWLTDQTQTSAAISMLSKNLSTTGGGEIIAGNQLINMFADPKVDSRTPDIIVAPNVGVVYTGGGKKIAEHGGFALDDTNVMMLVSNPQLAAATIPSPVTTFQVAPTIVNMLRIQPSQLQAVQKEGTPILPGLQAIQPFH